MRIVQKAKAFRVQQPELKLHSELSGILILNHIRIRQSKNIY